MKNNCKSVTSRENSRQVSEEQGTKPSLYLVPSTSHLAPSESQSRPADAGRSATADAICWDSSEGWQGITDGDREAWRTAYPACDIAQELARADQWLRGNPTKAKRKAWRRFVTGWLSRTQDRGGSKTGQAAAPTPKAARRFWRSEFDRQMTDAEYAAAMRQRKTAGGVSLDLARTLTAEVRNAN